MFEPGEKVFFIDYPNRRIATALIQGVDYDGGIPKFWMKDRFGYYNRDSIYSTQSEADDRLENWIKQGINRKIT